MSKAKKYFIIQDIILKTYLDVCKLVNEIIFFSDIQIFHKTQDFYVFGHTFAVIATSCVYLSNR